MDKLTPEQLRTGADALAMALDRIAQKSGVEGVPIETEAENYLGRHLQDCIFIARAALYAHRATAQNAPEP